MVTKFREVATNLEVTWDENEKEHTGWYWFIGNILVLKLDSEWVSEWMGSKRLILSLGLTTYILINMLFNYWSQIKKIFYTEYICICPFFNYVVTREQTVYTIRHI